MNAVHDDDCFLSGGDDGRFPCICRPPVQIAKCQCGDPVCNQYTLSSQGSIGFSLEDATLYAAAPDLFDALTAILHTYDDGGTPLGVAFKMANAAIAKAKGETK